MLLSRGTLKENGQFESTYFKSQTPGESKKYRFFKLIHKPFNEVIIKINKLTPQKANSYCLITYNPIYNEKKILTVLSDYSKKIEYFFKITNKSDTNFSLDYFEKFIIAFIEEYKKIKETFELKFELLNDLIQEEDKSEFIFYLTTIY